MNVEKMNVSELNRNEMTETNGGDIWALIQLMWDLTPWGWNSTWTNQGGGSWSGYYWR